MHQEIPYNIKVKNNLFKYLKNNNLKIKQSIEISNKRYKPIILGKKGDSILKKLEKKVKLSLKVFNCNIHLYLQVVVNDKKNK